MNESPADRAARFDEYDDVSRPEYETCLPLDGLLVRGAVLLARSAVVDGARAKIADGDVMLFGEADPGESLYDPEVDGPTTERMLAEAFTATGFALTAVAPVHERVLVGKRTATGRDDPPGGTGTERASPRGGT